MVGNADNPYNFSPNFTPTGPSIPSCRYESDIEDSPELPTLPFSPDCYLTPGPLLGMTQIRIQPQITSNHRQNTFDSWNFALGMQQVRIYSLLTHQTGHLSTAIAISAHNSHSPDTGYCKTQPKYPFTKPSISRPFSREHASQIAARIAARIHPVIFTDTICQLLIQQQPNG